ncbi:MAG: four helix bundle protein [Patescibacteria group bacterium]
MNPGWEQKQGELWERVFQVTQDVVSLADLPGEGTGMNVCKTEMVKSAMNVGRHLVRANAADEAARFKEALEEARLSAIETDYWLRLLYLLQQEDEVQRDLSGIINQYSAIVELLGRLTRQAAPRFRVERRKAR